MIRAGELRNLVIIEREVETPDGQGGATRDWQPIGEWWVAIQPLSAFERARAGGSETGISHLVTGRYRADVTGDCRLRLGTRIFQIVGEPRDIEERHEALELSCTEYRETTHGGAG